MLFISEGYFAMRCQELTSSSTLGKHRDAGSRQQRGWAGRADYDAAPGTQERSPGFKLFDLETQHPTSPLAIGSAQTELRFALL